MFALPISAKRQNLIWDGYLDVEMSAAHNNLSILTEVCDLGHSLCLTFEEFTIASCRPMLPTVTPPEKNMHGSQERTYRKSGDVYLQDRKQLDDEADPNDKDI